jgi:hypothetical protein
MASERKRELKRQRKRREERQKAHKKEAIARARKTAPRPPR